MVKRVAMLVTGALAACAPVPEATRIAQPGISGRVWELRALQGERVTSRKAATLRFNPDRTVTGTSACNHVGPGKLQWTSVPGEVGGTINADGAGAGIITVVGCGDASAVVTAGRFWRLMDTARTWSVDRGGLSINFADGSAAYLIPVLP